MIKSECLVVKYFGGSFLLQKNLTFAAVQMTLRAFVGYI